MKNQNSNDIEDIKETNFLNEELIKDLEKTPSDSPMPFHDDTPPHEDQNTQKPATSIKTTSQTKKIQVEADDTAARQSTPADSESWFGKEGELAIDVYQTDSDIVIQSAIAGVKSEELDIALENDVVTIRGIRKNPNQEEEKQYFHEECFWGPFSRQIFLPEEVDTKSVEASIKEGILTLRLPKAEREKNRKVKVAKN